MTQEEFKNLREGDIIQGQFQQEAYIVTGNYGSHVTVVRTLDITNYYEWQVIRQPPEKYKRVRC